jgi:hypothetical protein
MQIGQGYIIRQMETGDLRKLLGILIMGITISIGGTGSFNLIGNPYPSALDASQFLSTNSEVLGGTIYFGRQYGNPGKNKYFNRLQAQVIWLIRQMIMQHGTVGGETRPAATTDKVLPRIPSGNAAGQAFFSLQARVLRR